MHVSDQELSTIAQGRFDISQKPEHAFTIDVIEGLDAGKRMELNGGEAGRILVGTSAACSLNLSDPAVSRRHLALEWIDGNLVVTDEGSRNGTLVDHLSITGAKLVGGEVIRIGGSALRVSKSAAEPADVGTEMRFGKIVGASLEMRRLYGFLRKVAATDLTVLIEGETGTGKEVLAESIHDEGARASGPFVVFDCTTVAPNLLESELFGHERGAFTGADATRKGPFEEAEGGTLFIDEIGELDLSLQQKLLRVVERGEFKRVGSDKWRKANVRILAATRRDLDKAVQAGRFRDDLFHRLALCRVELPPLRARKGDVSILAQYFAMQLGGEGKGLSPQVLAKWSEWNWPGNVRELKNRVAQQLAMGDSEMYEFDEAGSIVEIESDEASHVTSDLVDQAIKSGVSFSVAKKKLVREFERRYLQRVLDAHGGNVVRAAAASGIGRRYFQIVRARQK